LAFFLPALVSSVELTFELPDNARECFHENIQKGIQTTFEFQVVTGGHYDVDVQIETPTKQVIYKEVKKQYDTFPFVPEVTGTYSFCFSNEFSTFSHKLVYMDLQVGDESPLPGVGEHITAMTQLETSAQSIHENLNSVIDYQTHHRLREAQGRKRAEDLNERVQLWSILETLAVFSISVGQVLILRNFFSEKKPSDMRNPLLNTKY
jgi:protein ERP2